MAKDRHKTKVVFKVLEGETIALFPEIPENNNCIMSYMHIGQHSAASKDLIEELPNAGVDDYSLLETELEKIGYNLTILN